MSSIVPDVVMGNLGTQITVQVTKPDPSITFEAYVAGGATQRVAVDIGSATLLQVQFEKPKGQTVTVTGTIKNAPGTDGRIFYTDSVGIFDVKGIWKVRGIATFSATQKFTGTYSTFVVGDG